MDPYLGYEIALALVIAYILIVWGLYRAGFIGPDHPLTLFGPALMIKTRRGLTALDRWGRFKRFWTPVSDLGITLAAVAMTAIIALLVADAIVAVRIPASQAPSVQEALGIPGINPIIPVTYGIVALVVGIVLHELMHGVIARSQGIGVKSIGVLFCVIPIGAFVEQNEQDMNEASRRKRDRVAAAGVLANFALAAVFFVALSGIIATSVAPNANGVGIAYVQPGTPAANATLVAGDILTSVNHTATPTAAAFQNAMANTTPNETVALSYYTASTGGIVTTSVVLAPSPTVKGRGFLGVSVDFLTPGELKQTLIWPYSSAAGPFLGGVYWLVLPLAGLEPVSGSTVNYFHLTGVFANTNPTTFWFGANILYWLAWMNLLLGLSNSLPLVPLDGGLLFRDFASSIAARLRKGWDAARLDAFGAKAAIASSLIVLFLLLWQFVAPRIF